MLRGLEPKGERSNDPGRPVQTERRGPENELWLSGASRGALVGFMEKVTLPGTLRNQQDLVTWQWEKNELQEGGVRKGVQGERGAHVHSSQ